LISFSTSVPAVHVILRSLVLPVPEKETHGFYFKRQYSKFPVIEFCESRYLSRFFEVEIIMKGMLLSPVSFMIQKRKIL